jgi:ketosteroid isomerase-like protein
MNWKCAASRRWLEEFATCVRNRDIAAGRELFATEVRSFGSRVEQVENVEELVKRQWSRVWFDTRGFRFHEETVREVRSRDGDLVCVFAVWSSEGVGEGGRSFLRRGRCTIVLRREAAHPVGYVAVHTHFSKTPPDEL